MRNSGPGDRLYGGVCRGRVRKQFICLGWEGAIHISELGYGMPFAREKNPENTMCKQCRVSCVMSG